MKLKVPIRIGLMAFKYIGMNINTITNVIVGPFASRSWNGGSKMNLVHISLNTLLTLSLPPLIPPCVNRL